jgi:hypothetical protein
MNKLTVIAPHIRKQRESLRYRAMCKFITGSYSLLNVGEGAIMTKIRREKTLLTVSQSLVTGII